MNVRYKFVAATIFAFFWSISSIYLASDWSNELAEYLGFVFSWMVIFGIAIFPGFMNAFLLSSLILDKRPKRIQLLKYPDITILIAAYNEESAIESTLFSIEKQDYSGHVRTIILNDGSTDKTHDIVLKFLDTYPEMDATLVDIEDNAGKAEALNFGLKICVKTSHVVTVDADCYLYKDALKNIVERIENDPDNTAAVAGCVLVRNSRYNLLTKSQEWGYFHGIAAIKRIQSMYQGTLVAQGAFSIYKTQYLEENNGWSNTVGEDIVLTWDLLNKGYRIGYAEDAFVFTNAPTSWIQFIRQRQRWSRGLIEAFKSNSGLLFKAQLSTMFIWWNLTFPYLDVAYSLFFVPGLIAALFGYYQIVGLMTVALLPMSMLINASMFFKHKPAFKESNLFVRKNRIGFIFYSLFYSIVLQPACVLGYCKEIFNGARKNWGTK